MNDKPRPAGSSSPRSSKRSAPSPASTTTAVVDSITATATTNRQLVSLLANLRREPGLDIACRRRPEHHRAQRSSYGPDGAAIPAADRPKPRPGAQHRCPACRRPTRQANTTNCRACVAENNAARTSICSNCGRAVRDATDGLCGHCHRWAQHRCATCDATTDLVTGDDGALRCHRCRLADDLRPLAGDNPADWVVEICDALRQAKSVASTRQWLASSSGGRLLARLVTGEVEFTHDELDRRSDRSVERLRGLLIATGALAADERRIEHIAESVTAIADTITDDADRRVVQSWLRWQALPRIRRRAETGKPILHSAQNLRRKPAPSPGSSDGLNDQDRTLADCRQIDIDHWFTAPGATPALITPFLNWAAAKGHLRAGLDIPTPSRSREPTTPLINNAVGTSPAASSTTTPSTPTTASPAPWSSSTPSPSPASPVSCRPAHRQPRRRDHHRVRHPPDRPDRTLRRPRPTAPNPPPTGRRRPARDPLAVPLHPARPTDPSDHNRQPAPPHRHRPPSQPSHRHHPARVGDPARAARRVNRHQRPTSLEMGRTRRRELDHLHQNLTKSASLNQVRRQGPPPPSRRSRQPQHHGERWDFSAQHLCRPGLPYVGRGRTLSICSRPGIARPLRSDRCS